MARTYAHVLFQDKLSKEFYIISDSSLEYPDYLRLEEQGHVERLCLGTKRECEAFQDERTEEFATLEF